MKVEVQFFSQLKDVMQTAALEMEMPPGATVADLLGQLFARSPKLRDWEKNLLVGAGVEFVGREHRLRPNEQIAIMPPVQGG